MNLKDKLLRSRITKNINYSAIESSGQHDPLMKVESSGNILVEPFWTLEDNFEGGMYADYIAEHPEYDGIYVRSELLKRLVVAAESLDSRYRLVIRAGHRPMAVQRRLLQEIIDGFKNDNPHATDAEALAHTRIFVSDPAVELPPHVSASAVDVALIDTGTGALIDFGSKVNDNTESSSLYYDNLTDLQKDNRLLLTTAMLDAGFASCASEWWHFSYGDQVWAWFYGKEFCLYSPVDLFEETPLLSPRAEAPISTLASSVSN